MAEVELAARLQVFQLDMQVAVAVDQITTALQLQLAAGAEAHKTIFTVPVTALTPIKELVVML
jgi:hypothetical protein